uniref:Uncharacterized protein n=1 Tax=Zooxanthella nutricula TaxID=1333877 RepID=A0A7S2QJE8_9DINO
MLRVQSPARSPRITATSGVAQFDNRRSRGRQVQMQGAAARQYVIATAHSPAPNTSPAPQAHRVVGSSTLRTASPLQGHTQQVSVQHGGSSSIRAQVIPGKPTEGNPLPAFVTPRMASRARSPTSPASHAAADPASPGSPTAAGTEGGSTRQPPWAFRPDGGEDGDGYEGHGRPVRGISPSGFGGHRIIAGSSGFAATAASPARYMASPTRGAVTYMQPPRSPSPVQAGVQLSPVRPTPSQIRTASPVAANGRFTWSQVPLSTAAMSPRIAGGPGGTAVSRTASPMNMAGPAVSHHNFFFNPDPPSPRVEGRKMSPVPGAQQRSMHPQSVSGRGTITMARPTIPMASTMSAVRPQAAPALPRRP